MNNLLIVDVSGFVYRNHFAFSKRITNGGSFGALRTILKLVDELKIDGLVFCFDTMRSSLRRTNMYSNYKQTRKPTPTSIIEQVKTFKTIATKMGITCLEYVGYEADDLVWTAIKTLSDKYDKIYVATSDKDLNQVLRNDNIYIVHDGKLDLIMDRNGFINTHEFNPEQIPDLFGLIGDNADNIPGVKGIGYHTARKLIKEYNSLEMLIAGVSSDPNISDKIKKLILDNLDDAYLSKKLAELEICGDVPKDLDASFTRRTWEGVFKEYDFKSLKKYARYIEKKYLLSEEQLKTLGIDPNKYNFKEL